MLTTTTCFIEQLYAIIETRLDDSSFSVEHLAKGVSMSRANLHRKLKKTTGSSPGILIRTYRLQRAIHFLKENCNSSTTAYKAGFDSPAYFSKCFREHFGVTPIQVHKGN